jgi:hypothetical protein
MIIKSKTIQLPMRCTAWVLIGLWLCGLASGCGGGGGPSAGGGIGGSGFSIGSVSAVGSVTVNGRSYNTETAEVYIDGEFIGAGDAAVAARIDLGKVVRVEMESFNNPNRRAVRIDFSADVAGPVDSVLPAGMLIVMGQAVMVDGGTRFKNTALENLAAGQMLEISGFADELGIVHASFVAKISDAPAPGQVVRLKGAVQDLDPVLKTFSIQLLKVDYASLGNAEMPDGEPVEGERVKVAGTLDAQGNLTAARITFDDELGADDADIAEIQGFITEFSSILQFDLSGNSVRTDPSTVFSGIEPGDLAVGELAVVKGVLRDGVLFADRIKLP